MIAYQPIFTVCWCIPMAPSLAGRSLSFNPVLFDSSFKYSIALSNYESALLRAF